MNIWNRLTLIEDVYQKLISWNAGRGQIQIVPVLLGDYNHRLP